MKCREVGRPERKPFFSYPPNFLVIALHFIAAFFLVLSSLPLRFHSIRTRLTYSHKIRTVNMGDEVAKKRKRHGVDAATVTKKASKKAKNPAPPAEDSEDDSAAEHGASVETPVSEENADDESDEEMNGAESEDVVEPPTNGSLLPEPAPDSLRFDELKLSDKTMKAINEMGFSKMTAIQRTVWNNGRVAFY